MGDDFDPVGRHAIDVAKKFTALAGHHDDFRGHLDDARHDSALSRRRRRQHGVQRGDDRHAQAGEQSRTGPGFTTENSEFVLQSNDIEPRLIQEIGSPYVVIDYLILNLKSDDRGRIIIGVTVIRHSHDAGLQAWP